MHQPIISVIIPTYNIAPYLPRCLDSVLNQTYPNIEIVAVDDGSTDDTAKVLQSYAEQHATLRVIQQENSGVSAARNAGLEAATGEYLFFLDGDDWLSPTALERLYSAAADADLVQGVLSYTYDDGTEEILSDFADTTATDPCEQLWLYFMDILQDSACNKLFRRETVGAARFDTAMAVGEDSHFVYTVLKKTHTVRLITDVTYHYYMRSDSCVHAALQDKHFAVLPLRDRQYPEICSDKRITEAFYRKYAEEVFHLIHCVLQDGTPAFQKRLSELRARVMKSRRQFLSNPHISKKFKVGIVLLWFAPPVFYRVYRRIRANER